MAIERVVESEFLEARSSFCRFGIRVFPIDFVFETDFLRLSPATDGFSGCRIRLVIHLTRAAALLLCNTQ